jgi:hypothetical protein
MRNAGVDILAGPGTAAVSGGLSETFAVTERAKLWFEMTFTNLPNHPDFAAPLSSWEKDDRIMRQNGIKTDTVRWIFRPLQLIAFLSAAVTAVAALNFTPAVSFLPDPVAGEQRRWQEPVPETPQGDASIKLGTQLVSLSVTVTDRSGRLIEGLKKEDFKIYDEKVEQPISFFSDQDVPISVGIIFDTSSSMSGDKIVRAKDALARLVETSHEEDEYFLVGFDSTTRLLLDGVQDGDVVLDRLSKVSRAARRRSMMPSISGSKRSRGIYPKHAIILISDGEDNYSRCSLQYSIGYLPSNFMADGRWHRVKVAMTQKSSRLVVRSREGYYAIQPRMFTESRWR